MNYSREEQKRVLFLATEVMGQSNEGVYLDIDSEKVVIGIRDKEKEGYHFLMNKFLYRPITEDAVYDALTEMENTLKENADTTPKE